MNILLHVGVGNNVRPERWWGVCVILSNLSKSLVALGHECFMYCHPHAVSNNICPDYLLSEEVQCAQLDTIKKKFNPDIVITWNGASEGDQKMIEYFGRDKCVFGELGFFDHYETVYFDFSGTNCKSQNLVDKISHESIDEETFSYLVRKYKQPSAWQSNNPFVFVAMQDEKDTNVTKWSPFNTMNELLSWVCDVTTGLSPDLKIVYKKHPKAPCNITINDPRLVEVVGNVHSYIPYAEWVFGCNSTVLFECLLYHNRIITAGLGLSSRPINNNIDRIRYVVHCYNKQIHQTNLADHNHIKETWFYKTLMEKYNANT